MSKLIVAAMVALVAASPAAFAGSKKKHYDVDKHKAALANKIEEGRQDGSVTFFEGLRLRRQLRSIESYEQALRADGKLSYKDKVQLRRELAQLNRNIDAESNDRWSRWRILPRVGK